jgi:hypothetical protein
MKFKLLISLLVVCLLSSCSKNRHIPNISIFEEIPTEKLADAIKAEENKTFIHEKFEEMYPIFRSIVGTMSEVDKAKVAHLTYRDLIDAMDIMDDTIAESKISKEWQAKYDKYLPQAKKEAEEMRKSLLFYVRVESYKDGYTRNFSYYAKKSPYFKYMTRIPFFYEEVDDCWDYVKIIKDKYDANFVEEWSYYHHKQLELIEKDYPEAYYFYSYRLTKYEAEMKKYEDALLRQMME